MEKGRALINTELKQGRELANQLKQHFVETTQQSKQTCDALLTDILSSYEKALSILKSNALGFEHHSPVISIINSPHSFTSDSSPASDISDEPSKNVFRKRSASYSFYPTFCRWFLRLTLYLLCYRKALPQWSEQVEVPLGTGAEVPLADGHSWRKYGQKDILGATFPRWERNSTILLFWLSILYVVSYATYLTNLMITIKQKSCAKTLATCFFW